MDVLSRLAKKIVATETDEQKTNKYLDMMHHEGWQVYTEWLLTLRGFMAEHMLNREFAQLDPTQKDIQQRVYYLTDKVILFLLNPMGKARQLAKYQYLYQKVRGATQKRDVTK